MVWNGFDGSTMTVGACSSGCSSGAKGTGGFDASRSPVSLAVTHTLTFDAATGGRLSALPALGTRAVAITAAGTSAGRSIVASGQGITVAPPWALEGSEAAVSASMIEPAAYVKRTLTSLLTPGSSMVTP